MRATLGTTYRTLQTQINQMSDRLNSIRMVATSGKKVNKPSDDPTAIEPILNSRAQIRANDQYMKTMGQGLDKIQTVESHLAHMENILVNAKEIAINSINGAMDSQSRVILADNIGHLKDELLAAANTKINGKYIFAGYEEGTLPFTTNPVYDPLNPLSRPILYNGDNNATSLEISPGETVEVSLSGNELFLGDADNDGTVDAGSADMFATLTKIEEALRANNPSGVEAQLDNLDVAADQNRQLRARMGNNAQRIETASGHLENAQIDMKAILSRYEDADIIETLTSLTQQETAFEAALKVTAEVSRLSILDFI